MFSLTLTCKELFDPAVAALWSELDSLLPLLRLLPRDLFELVDTDGNVIATSVEPEENYRGLLQGIHDGDDFGEREHYRLRMRRPMERKDWERLAMYAQHVRTLRLDGFWETITDHFMPTTITDLASALRSRSSTLGPLLPGLRSLEFGFINAPDADQSPSMQLIQNFLSFSGPHVQHMVTSADTTSLYPSIHTSCTNITTLKLSMASFELSDPHIESKLRGMAAHGADSMICLPNVSRLTLPFIHSMFCGPIPSLGRLTHLTLRHFQGPLFTNSTVSLASPTLQQLEFQADISHVCDFLPRVGQVPRLDAIRIVGRPYFGVSQCSSAVVMLASSISAFKITSGARKLRTLYLRLDVPFEGQGTWGAPPEPVRLLSDRIEMLRSISQLRDLTELSVRCNQPFLDHALVSKHFPQITERSDTGIWSSLQSLHLGCSDRPYLLQNPSSVLDLADLRQLMVYCPNLRCLRVELNATKIPPDDAPIASLRRTGSKSRHADRTMELLVLADSPILDQPETVARFLGRLFLGGLGEPSESLTGSFHRVLVKFIEPELRATGILSISSVIYKQWQNDERDEQVKIWGARWREVSRILGTACNY